MNERDLDERLRISMVVDYEAVNVEHNPVARKLALASDEWLLAVLAQYLLLPRNIVAILMATREVLRASDRRGESMTWRGATTELTRNIGEELGSETNGVPHVELLLGGLERSLGDVGLRTTPASMATQHFLDALMPTATLSTIDDCFMLGVVYALEASAVPELTIVKKMVLGLFEKQGVDYTEELDGFFQRHLQVWEPGHERELWQSVSDPVGHMYSMARAFFKGFHHAMDAMNTWWWALSEIEVKKDHL